MTLSRTLGVARVKGSWDSELPISLIDSTLLVGLRDYQTLTFRSLLSGEVGEVNLFPGVDHTILFAFTAGIRGAGETTSRYAVSLLTSTVRPRGICYHLLVLHDLTQFPVIRSRIYRDSACATEYVMGTFLAEPISSISFAPFGFNGLFNHPERGYRGLISNFSFALFRDQLWMLVRGDYQLLLASFDLRTLSLNQWLPIPIYGARGLDSVVSLIAVEYPAGFLVSDSGGYVFFVDISRSYPYYYALQTDVRADAQFYLGAGEPGRVLFITHYRGLRSSIDVRSLSVADLLRFMTVTPVFLYRPSYLPTDGICAHHCVGFIPALSTLRSFCPEPDLVLLTAGSAVSSLHTRTHWVGQRPQSVEFWRLTQDVMVICLHAKRKTVDYPYRHDLDYEDLPSMLWDQSYDTQVVRVDYEHYSERDRKGLT